MCYGHSISPPSLTTYKYHPADAYKYCPVNNTFAAHCYGVNINTKVFLTNTREKDKYLYFLFHATHTHTLSTVNFPDYYVPFLGLLQVD